MEHKIILAFTGLLASGKDTARDYFIERHGAAPIKYSAALRDTLSRFYLEQNRKNMQLVSTVLRQAFGQDLLSKVVRRDVEAARSDLVVMDGVRRPADIVDLRKLSGFKLIAIETPARMRFLRMQQRRENPDDQKKTWERFLLDEKAESDSLIPKIMKEADYRLDNSGSIEQLHQQLEKVYSSLRHED